MHGHEFPGVVVDQPVPCVQHAILELQELIGKGVGRGKGGFHPFGSVSPQDARRMSNAERRAGAAVDKRQLLLAGIRLIYREVRTSGL